MWASVPARPGRSSGVRWLHELADAATMVWNRQPGLCLTIHIRGWRVSCCAAEEQVC